MNSMEGNLESYMVNLWNKRNRRILRKILKKSWSLSVKFKTYYCKFIEKCKFILLNFANGRKKFTTKVVELSPLFENQSLSVTSC